MTNLARQTDITAFIPDSVTWEWSRPSRSEVQVGRLKGPKHVTYTMICWGAPLMTGAWQTKQDRYRGFSGCCVWGWRWDCCVQAFKKPMHVSTDKSLSIPSTLLSLFPYANTDRQTDRQTDQLLHVSHGVRLICVWAWINTHAHH